MAEDSVHLQNVGSVPAKPASEVRPGDVLLYNFGYSYTVMSVALRGKSVVITERSDDSGREYQRTRRTSTLVGWDPGSSRSVGRAPSRTEIERDVVRVATSEYDR